MQELAAHDSLSPDEGLRVLIILIDIGNNFLLQFIRRSENSSFQWVLCERAKKSLKQIEP